MKHTLPLLAILLAITFLPACKKDSSVDVFELEITLPKTQLKALELALIEVNASVNETESFTGSIESESVEFHPNGRFLIFKVPSGNPGLKSGSVSVNGEEFMFEYQLMANSFSDAEIFLTNYLSEQSSQQQELEDLQQEFIEDSIPGFQDIQSDLDVWNQIAADAEAEYAAMSAQDKEMLAQLLDANSEWLQRLENAMLNRSFYLSNKFTESDYTKQDCRDLINEGQLEQIEGNTFSALALGIEAYWCGLTFEERQYEDVSNDFERGVLLMEDVEFDPGPGFINTVTNLVVRKMDALTKELQGLYSSNGIADELLDVDNKVQSDLILRNGYPEPIFAQIRFRSMTENDVNANGQIGQSATFFSSIISNYNDVLESVDRPLIWRPGFTQTTVIKEFNRFLSVPQQSVTNNDVILVNTQIVDDNWELVFGNDGNDPEPTFNFDLRYDDGYVQLQKTINAQLVDGCASPCAGETTYTDSRDGKTYQLVEIGCQCWFEENLRFSDGINEITDGSDWADAVDAQEPAWCFYENNSANEATYGKIYSWGAINSGNLCPNGWHIPSASEWSVLVNHLGGEYFAGGKMKSTTGWNAPNTDATNSSGFTGLPGGFRFNGGGGSFDYAGDEGYWWSSTQSVFPGTGRYRSLRSSSGAIQEGDSGSVVASFSCRCVKD